MTGPSADDRPGKGGGRGTGQRIPDRRLVVGPGGGPRSVRFGGSSGCRPALTAGGRAGGVRPFRTGGAFRGAPVGQVGPTGRTVGTGGPTGHPGSGWSGYCG
nr:hypothetical protein KPHV_48990 [Kitasatospora purpeofusca]